MDELKIATIVDGTFKYEDVSFLDDDHSEDCVSFKVVGYDNKIETILVQVSDMKIVCKSQSSHKVHHVTQPLKKLFVPIILNTRRSDKATCEIVPGSQEISRNLRDKRQRTYVAAISVELCYRMEDKKELEMLVSAVNEVDSAQD